MEPLTKQQWLDAGRPANTLFTLTYQPKAPIPLTNKELAEGAIEQLNKETRKFVFLVHQVIEKYGASLHDLPGLYAVAKQFLNVQQVMPGVYCIWVVPQKETEQKWVAVSFVAHLIVNVPENGGVPNEGQAQHDE